MNATEMTLLRIYVDESDSVEGRPLYLTLVERCREMGIAGATVFRGVAGYGHHGMLHTDRLLDISHHLPIVIEVIDREEKIDAFLSEVGAMLAEKMVTTGRVTVACLPGDD